LIAIIDYGMGNLRSVQKGFAKAGWSARVVQTAREVLTAKGVVLPGVGAFANAMQNLRRADLTGAIRQVIAEGKPFLGICLGMQLLFEASEEWGLTTGLGIFPGAVKRLPAGLKIPHMGWNNVYFSRECSLAEGITQNAYFYFVHSYYVDTPQKEIIVGLTHYGLDFPSLVARKNVFGIQFHPEKSSALGLRILKNFGGLVAKNDDHPGD